jgi:hypothetical protein
MNIEKRPATQYPIRYDAFDNPGIWFEGDRMEKRGGKEIAVYHEPMPNQTPGYEHVTDGIHIEIVSYQGKDFLMDGCATRPSKNRTQFNYSERYPTYEAAWMAAEIYRIEAQRFCRV